MDLKKKVFIPGKGTVDACQATLGPGRRGLRDQTRLRGITTVRHEMCVCVCQPLGQGLVGPPHLPAHRSSSHATSHTHSAPPTQGPIQVTIPRPQHNGRLLPFNFSSDIKHYLNPTAHRTRQPLLDSRPSPPCPAPQPIYPPTSSTTTTTVFHQYHQSLTPH